MSDLLHCSFCGKSQDEVPILIAGPGRVFICSDDVAFCVGVIATALSRRETTLKLPPRGQKSLPELADASSNRPSLKEPVKP